VANAAEKENTFRALKDEPMLATRFLCRVNWHRWTKYSELRRERRTPYDYLVQYRNCDCCGIIAQNIIHKN